VPQHPDFQGTSTYLQVGQEIEIDWDRCRMRDRYGADWTPWVEVLLENLTSWETAAQEGLHSVTRISPPPQGRCWVEIGQVKP
jgi:hypothetical protein